MKKKVKTGEKNNKPLSVLMWGITLIFLIPFYTLFVYAFKSRGEIMGRNPLSFPTSLYLDNFIEVIKETNFFNSFKNSFIATSTGIVISVIICSMAAYIVVRRERKKFYYVWQYIFSSVIMIPFQTIMFPMYKNLVNLHMLNTMTGYILVVVGFQLGFNIFFYCGFIKTVPLELEEAARIDGCGTYGIFWRIVFPLLKPATMTVIVLTALAIWNDYQIGIVVVMKNEVQTLPIAQQQFIGQQVSYLNLASAACLLSIVPIFIMYLFLQKYIIKGVAAGAIKG